MAAALPPVIFDRALLRARLERAHHSGFEDFLLRRVVDDINDRLDSIKRTFHDALDLGTPAPGIADMLAARGIERVTRAAPVAAALGAGRWRGVVADEEALPFGAGQFDLIVSALSLQFVNDLPGALAQIRRALKPDGLFLGCLIGGGSLGELRASMTVAETELRGGASPRVAPFADVRDMGGLLQRAGFAMPVADVDTVTARYNHLFALARDLRAMGAANALAARERRPASRGLFARTAQVYGERFADTDGRVRATFEIVFMTGWSPPR